MNTHTETKHKEEPWWITGKPNTLGTYTVFHGHHRTQMASNQICQASTLFHARLIAAAPELLAALQLVMAHGVTHAVGCSHRQETCTCHRSRARAAITKATEGAQ